MAMLGYCTVGSNRLEEAKTFYDALLGSAGITPMFEHPSGGRVYGKERNHCFLVLGPYDGKAATVGNGSMFGFRFDTRQEVDAFHAGPDATCARIRLGHDSPMASQNLKSRCSLVKTFGVGLLLLCTNCWAANPAETPPRVNGPRIIRHLQGLSEYGKNPQGGVSRIAYTEADRAGREYVRGLMRDAGLELSIDTAGNLVGTRAGSDAALKPIVIGSHIDSVPEGGNYDGDVGSLGAIEVAQILKERGARMRHPLQVIIFENEEGVMLGSTAIARGADAARLNSVSQSGKIVRDGIQFLGGNPDRITEARRQPGSIAAYIELHIEQGGVLEQQHVQIGIVEGIVGILDSEVTVEGIANHAGTTPMDQRHDALLSAARFVEKFNQLVTSTSGRQVGTIGWIKAQPGAYNVIPGKVTIGMELRDLDAGKIKDLFERSREAADEIGRMNATTFHFSSEDVSAPALTDKHVQGLIALAARRLGMSTKLMPSGAGHDAQEMANLGPMGMIFIPSVGGMSHSPREFSHPGDIENGANVLLGTVLSLDR